MTIENLKKLIDPLPGDMEVWIQQTTEEQSFSKVQTVKLRLAQSPEEPMESYPTNDFMIISDDY